MSITQICTSINLVVSDVSIAVAMQQPDRAEELMSELHELAWQLVNETRPEDHES